MGFCTDCSSHSSVVDQCGRQRNPFRCARYRSRIQPPQTRNIPDCVAALSAGSLAAPCARIGGWPHRSKSKCAASPAQGGGKREVNPLSLEAAVDTMDQIWALATNRKLDELLHFIPDEVVEEAADLRPNNEPRSHLTFQDVVTHAHEIRGFTLDSFAERHLYFSPPTHGSVTRLSCIRTAPERAVLRYSVAADGGERAVLTFGLECAEMLVPHYRSARVEYVWQMISVTGEAATGDGFGASSGGQEGEHQEGGGGGGYLGEAGGQPTRPHPSLGPEAVVQAQLAALASENVAAVFAFASPKNQEVTGSVERFGSLLQNPQYRPLLRHRSVTSVHRNMLTSDSYSEIVEVVSDNTGMPHAVQLTYLWDVSRQGRDAGPLANCWLTDSVRLVSGKLYD